MSKKSPSSNTDQANAATVEPAAPPMDGVDFKSPILQVAKALLGPFLRHGPECTAEACTCGVKAAVDDLYRREELVKRYGIVD